MNEAVEVITVPMPLRVELSDVFALMGLAFVIAGFVTIYLAKPTEL